MATFQELIDIPKNNLNLIRLLAASAVTFSHAYILTGQQSAEPWFVFTGSQTFAYLAVFIFFVISGLLISRSFDRNPNVGHYIGSRALRIYPALIVSLLLCTIPLGLSYTNLADSTYLRNPQVYRYITDNLKFNINYELPGVFTNLPITNSVNGSLWTLAFEVYAYFMVILVGLLGLLKNRNLFNIVAAVLILLYLKEPAGFSLIPDEWTAPMYMPLIGFLFGVFVYVNRGYIQCRLQYVFIALAIYYIFQDSEFHRALFAVSIGYAALVVGFHPKLQLNAFATNDYSYGIYVYSFPIQQMMVSSAPSLQPLQHFFWVMFGIVPLAILSWHWLEEPAIRLKRLLPDSVK